MFHIYTIQKNSLILMFDIDSFVYPFVYKSSTRQEPFFIHTSYITSVVTLFAPLSPKCHAWKGESNHKKLNILNCMNMHVDLILTFSFCLFVFLFSNKCITFLWHGIPNFAFFSSLHTLINFIMLLFFVLMKLYIYGFFGNVFLFGDV